MSATAKKDKALSKLKGVLRSLPDQVFISKEEKRKFESEIFAQVEKKLSTLGGNGHSYAIFACDEFTLAYDVPNRLINYSGVAHNFFIQPILRIFAFSYEGYILLANKDNWELYLGTNTEEVKRVNIDKEGTGSVLEAANKLNDLKHQIQRSVKDTMKDALSVYGKRISEKIKTHVQNKDLVVVADKTLLSEIKAHTISTSPSAIFVPKSMSVNSPLYEIDHLLRTQLAYKHESDLQAFYRNLDSLRSKGLVLSDVSDIAAAAVSGRVHTLVLPYDTKINGRMDSITGKIEYDEEGDLIHSIVVAVAERSGTILAFREDEINGEFNGSIITATLRF